jgi:integrase
MPVIRINKTSVSKATPWVANPKGRPTFYFDDVLKGFGLKVEESGHKSYFVQARIKREKPRKRIGTHGTLTPDLARGEAERILARVALGENPFDEVRAERMALTLEEFFEQRYMPDAAAGVPMGKKGKPKKATTLHFDRGRFGRIIKPLLGTKLVKEIEPKDVQEFVAAVVVGKVAADIDRTDTNGIRKHGRVRVSGGPGSARRAVELLGGILSYAKKLGLRDDNPVAGVAKGSSDAKDRFLSEAEFKRLGLAMVAVEAEGKISRDFIDAVRLIALTGLRKNEALRLRWDEVDLDNQIIALGDSKTGKSKRPMGRAAVDLLRAREANKAADNVYVFESRKAPGRPMVGLAKAFEWIVAIAKLTDVSPHTLRHSIATHASAMGYAEGTIASLLGHKLQSITSRYTHQLDSVLVAAADRIADRIARMLDGRALVDAGNVHDLAAARSA